MKRGESAYCRCRRAAWRCTAAARCMSRTAADAVARPPVRFAEAIAVCGDWAAGSRARRRGACCSRRRGASRGCGGRRMARRVRPQRAPHHPVPRLLRGSGFLAWLAGGCASWSRGMPGRSAQCALLCSALGGSPLGLVIEEGRRGKLAVEARPQGAGVRWRIRGAGAGEPTGVQRSSKREREPAGSQLTLAGLPPAGPTRPSASGRAKMDAVARRQGETSGERAPLRTAPARLLAED